MLSDEERAILKVRCRRKERMEDRRSNVSEILREDLREREKERGIEKGRNKVSKGIRKEGIMLVRE